MAKQTVRVAKADAVLAPIAVAVKATNVADVNHALVNLADEEQEQALRVCATHVCEALANVDAAVLGASHEERGTALLDTMLGAKAQLLAELDRALTTVIDVAVAMATEDAAVKFLADKTATTKGRMMTLSVLEDRNAIVKAEKIAAEKEAADRAARNRAKAKERRDAAKAAKVAAK